MEYLTLANGMQMPILGFGTYLITDAGECTRSVAAAVENGSLTRERLELSAARVLRMKQNLGIWNP